MTCVVFLVHTDVQVWAVVCSGDYRDSVSVRRLHSRDHPMEVRQRDSMLYLPFTLYGTALYVYTLKRNFKRENKTPWEKNCWFKCPYQIKHFPEGCINRKNFFLEVLFTSQYILLQDKVPCSDEQG